MMAEALPTLLMLLPAAQGALTLSLGTYAEYLRDAGVNVPYSLPAALALITTASLAALARYLEHGISGEEYEVRNTVGFRSFLGCCCSFSVILGKPLSGATTCI